MLCAFIGYLLIQLFYDTVSTAEVTLHHMRYGTILMDDKLERMWRKVLSQQLPGRTEEYYEKASVMIASPQLGFKPGTF